jgi:hypothetical protein
MWPEIPIREIMLRLVSFSCLGPRSQTDGHLQEATSVPKRRTPAGTRVHNGPDRTFIVANALAEKLRWTRERFVKTRDCLEGSHLETVRRYSLKNDPALYRWKRLR